jgi:predicted nucleotidyltransferase
MTVFEEHLSAQPIADFCQRWHIRELALFGSVAGRSSTRPRSSMNPDEAILLSARLDEQA